jgi:hypothetical protein
MIAPGSTTPDPAFYSRPSLTWSLTRSSTVRRLAELDDREGVVREEVKTLVLGWTYRYELHHLLELAGFELVAEDSDDAGSPPIYGNEIIVVARRRDGRP